MRSEELTKLIEPMSGEARLNQDFAIQLSIAISLRRIAEELCGNSARLGLINAMFELEARKKL